MESFRPIGKGPYGNRMNVMFKGGQVEGPRLRGTLVSGGGDWEIVEDDGEQSCKWPLTQARADFPFCDRYRSPRHAIRDGDVHDLVSTSRRRRHAHGLVQPRVLIHRGRVVLVSSPSRVRANFGTCTTDPLVSGLHRDRQSHRVLVGRDRGVDPELRKDLGRSSADSSGLDVDRRLVRK